ncbi:MAG: hypothetical protein A2W90_04905 [Bacteroidetes bacterium GWF2_42_66]|nr:MAG: hypothetical protein A2W89_21125 [Bacteroidetes bacterium GWE2_42_39]OFY40855.1 MAG: hypothetical protein A2W90_04905 [Bacteroidetes bacterium GWF2_42_66]
MGNLNVIHEVQVIYKRPVINQMEKIKCSNDMVEVFRKLISEDQIDLKEFFCVALLSRSNQVLGVSTVGSGTATQTVVNVREILQLSLKTNANGIVICHNHPSGNLKASDSDIALTGKVKEACKLFEIALLDHIIITSEGYYSFADNGLI